MKREKSLIKRILEVALVVSCAFGMTDNQALALEPTLGEESAYTIEEGTISDHDYILYYTEPNNNVQSLYYKYNLKNLYINHSRIINGNGGEDIKSNFVNRYQVGRQNVHGGAIYLSEVDSS